MVTIDRIALLAYEWPRLELEIACGGGTYIRSIARDVGEALGCGGLVEVLVRTRIGPFGIESAIDLDALTAGTLPGFLRPAVEAVADMPRLVLTAEQVAAVARGQALPIRPFPQEDGLWANSPWWAQEGTWSRSPRASRRTERSFARRVLVKG